MSQAAHKLNVVDHASFQENDNLDEIGQGRCAPKILIVDDVSDNRAILLRRFQRRGFEVLEADSGRKAIECARSSDIDAILLDVMMPDMDGLETLRELRAMRSTASLPVIMVTARSESENIVEAIELGANDYVTKPVDFAVAFARVSAQIARKRAEDKVRVANQSLANVNNELEQRVAERTRRLFEANQQLQSEIQQRQESEAKSQFLAYHDALTGLGNRLLFKEQLELAIGNYHLSKQRFSILYIDLDGFKGVNDTLGHSTGDKLLNIVSNKLRDLLTERDRIARLGGDEFAVLMAPAESVDGAAILANAMINAISAPHVIDGQIVVIGASIGIVEADADDVNAEDLLKSADLAMYSAKAAGRGTYRIFDPEMDAVAQARRKLESDMRAGFASGEFYLVYQPLVNLQTKQVTGFEALMRWCSPTRGNVAPDVFIPVAEEIGLITQMGEWALRQACLEATNWPGDIRVAVNLSPVQFAKSSLVGLVTNALAATGLEPSRLELEVTEAALLEKPRQNIDILMQLKRLGVRIAMDDFGSSYSSLGYLRYFRFDKIKIDQEFIGDFMKNPDNLAIVKAIMNLGISLGIATTAEGVETEDQMRCLNLEGCTEIQGNLYSRPVQADEIGSLLNRLVS
jgi:diguanylate cyclase (GGDEF)-like protein